MALVLASCHSAPATSAPPTESREQCVARLAVFEDSVAKLPDRTVAAATGGDLPSSTLGALPGPGPVLELAENGAAIDGTPLPGATHAERASHLAEWLAGTSATTSVETAPAAAPAAARAAFYVAASADADVQTVRTYVTKLPATFDVRLLVRLPKPAGTSAHGTESAAGDPATRVLLEQDPESRRKIAEEGYAELARCPAVSTAVASVRGLGPRERWPALKSALRAALPQCDCSAVDTVRLQALVAAERQGGAGAIGFVPISFLRDERCGASMPLRSMRKLIKQIEQFDAEFAGNWQKDALAFGDVVTDARLLVYFCSALPGETLAQKERDRATLYLRAPGTNACEAWKFEPLAPGTPMGTWRRTSHPPLAFHYWQAAEEIRVFGPVDASSPSKPTDQRDWACEQTHRLTGIDDHYIQLDSGRWYFDDATCRKGDSDVPTAPPCTKPVDSAPSAAPAEPIPSR
jgi:hypothetical protein